MGRILFCFLCRILLFSSKNTQSFQFQSSPRNIPRAWERVSERYQSTEETRERPRLHFAHVPWNGSCWWSRVCVSVELEQTGHAGMLRSGSLHYNRKNARFSAQTFAIFTFKFSQRLLFFKHYQRTYRTFWALPKIHFEFFFHIFFFFIFRRLLDQTFFRFHAFFCLFSSYSPSLFLKFICISPHHPLLFPHLTAKWLCTSDERFWKLRRDIKTQLPNPCIPLSIVKQNSKANEAIRFNLNTFLMPFLPGHHGLTQ